MYIAFALIAFLLIAFLLIALVNSYCIQKKPLGRTETNARIMSSKIKIGASKELTLNVQAWLGKERWSPETPEVCVLTKTWLCGRMDPFPALRDELALRRRLVHVQRLDPRPQNHPRTVGAIQ